jgi:hypothetical protein
MNLYYSAVLLPPTRHMVAEFEIAITNNRNHQMPDSCLLASHALPETPTAADFLCRESDRQRWNLLNLVEFLQLGWMWRKKTISLEVAGKGAAISCWVLMTARPFCTFAVVSSLGETSNCLRDLSSFPRPELRTITRKFRPS